MPASLLLASSPTLRGVTRNESTRSDSSAASNTSQGSATGNKKVSFNKAVRVKKYPRPKRNEPIPADDEQQHHDVTNGDKKFWFKVYKNKHRQSPSPGDFRNQVIYYGNDGEVDHSNGYHRHDEDDVISYHPNPSELNYPVFTSECGTQTPCRKENGHQRTALLGNEFTPLHPSQMPTELPAVKKNHVKKIVHRFNEEAVLQHHKPSDSDPVTSPTFTPMEHSTPIPAPPPPPPPVHPYSYNEPQLPVFEGLFTTPRNKPKNPLVNGVKVMFGIKEEEPTKQTSPMFSRKYEDDVGDYRPKTESRYHKTEKAVSNDSDTDAKVPYTRYHKTGKAVFNGSDTDVKVPYSRYHKTEKAVSNGSDTDVKVPYKPTEKFYFGDNGHHNGALVERNGKFDVNTTYRSDDDGYDYYYGDDYANKQGKYHVETFDTGNELVFDTEDVNTETGKTFNGHFMTTTGEKHQMWRNNKRIVVYEEPSPTIVRRKAKSQSDLTQPDNRLSHEDKLDKGVSTDELFDKKYEKNTLSKKDSWFKHLRSPTKEKGIQCNKVPTDEPEELYSFGKYRIIKPRNGVVSAFSNVPKLNKTKKDETVSSQIDGYDSKDSVIYSQIDKSKKKRNGEKEKKKNFFSENSKFGSLFKTRSEPLYIGPPPKTQQPNPEEEIDDVYFDKDRTIKTTKKGFGFRLNTSRLKKSGRSPYHEEDWYNIDGDIEAMERQKTRDRNHRDISEIRQEIAEEEISDASSLSNTERRNGVGSVMREVDYKKREISYENVPRSDGESNGHQNVSGGLWYRDADEDYRRGMAQNEASYPAGTSVAGDRFYTVDRKEKSSKKLPPPSPRAYTLDRRHMKNKDKSLANTSGVKILVNGKEVKDKTLKKNRLHDDPSSVQSDPVSVRGGLAAAYQARQRAAVRRSNSSVSGLSKYHSGSSPNIRRIVSSDMSADGSESESSRQRRPLVMYIPGISHTEKAPENDNRVSSSIARSQSMLSPTRPPRMVKRRSHKGSKTDLYRNGDVYYEEDEIMPLASESRSRKPPKVPSDSKKDIKRRHSMPKDTKFGWLKWKLRGKPSREP